MFVPSQVLASEKERICSKGPFFEVLGQRSRGEGLASADREAL